MKKTYKKSAFSLIEILIYSTLLSLIILFLIQIIIYYQKSSKTIDQISIFQMKINSALAVMDYDFGNAGYTALQDGVVLSSFYYVDQNGQVINNNIASDVRKIKLTNNNDKDTISFYYFDIQENNLAYIGSATALGGGNSAEIDVDPSVVDMSDPSFQAMWPDPNMQGSNPNSNGVQPYYVIAYAPDANGNWVGVLFYITNVQYNANHLQHRPLSFYGGNLNKDIISYLPSNNIRVMKPKEIYKMSYYIDANNNLIREVYNFRTDNPISSVVLLSNVESFNIQVALDENNDNQVDLNNGEPVWRDSIPNGLEDKVAMIRYTIVLRSNIRNLIGLDRNPLTNAGNDGFKRYMLYRVVTLKNIVNPSI